MLYLKEKIQSNDFETNSPSEYLQRRYSRIIENILDANHRDTAEFSELINNTDGKKFIESIQELIKQDIGKSTFKLYRGIKAYDSTIKNDKSTVLSRMFRYCDKDYKITLSKSNDEFLLQHWTTLKDTAYNFASSTGAWGQYGIVWEANVPIDMIIFHYDSMSDLEFVQQIERNVEFSLEIEQEVVVWHYKPLEIKILENSYLER